MKILFLILSIGFLQAQSISELIDQCDKTEFKKAEEPRRLLEGKYESNKEQWVRLVVAHFPRSSDNYKRNVLPVLFSISEKYRDMNFTNEQVGMLFALKADRYLASFRKGVLLRTLDSVLYRHLDATIEDEFNE